MLHFVILIVVILVKSAICSSVPSQYKIDESSPLLGGLSQPLYRGQLL